MLPSSVIPNAYRGSTENSQSVGQPTQKPNESEFTQLLISGTLAHEADFFELQDTYGVFITPQVAIVVSIDRAELLALLRIGDESEVAAHLRTLLDRMAQSCQYNEDLFKSEVVDLVMLMSRTALESDVSAAAVLSSNADFIHRMYKTIRYDKFVDKVLAHGQWLTAQVGQAQTKKVSPIIRQAIHSPREYRIAKSC